MTKKGKILTAVLCVALAALLFQNGTLRAEIQNLRQETQSLSNHVLDMQQYVMDFYYTARGCDRLVSSWGITSAINQKDRCLDVMVDLRLKTWQEDTTAELLWDKLEGGTESFPMTAEGDGCFQTALSLGLERAESIWLDVIVSGGGTQNREALGGLGDFASLLPIHCNRYHTAYVACQDGVFTAENGDAAFCSIDGKDLALRDVEFRLRRNGEIVSRQAGEASMEQPALYRHGKLEAECRPEDEMAVTCFCRDQSGVGYEFFLDGWTIGDSLVIYSSPKWEEWPRLTLD